MRVVSLPSSHATLQRGLMASQAGSVTPASTLGSTAFSFTATAAPWTITTTASSKDHGALLQPQVVMLCSPTRDIQMQQDCWRSPDVQAVPCETLRRWERQLQRSHHRQRELQAQQGILSTSLREAEGNMRHMQEQWRQLVERLEEVSEDLVRPQCESLRRSSSAHQRDRRSKRSASAAQRSRSVHAGEKIKAQLLDDLPTTVADSGESSLTKELAAAHAATVSLAKAAGWSPAEARSEARSELGAPQELTSASEHCRALEAQLQRAGRRIGSPKLGKASVDTVPPAAMGSTRGSFASESDTGGTLPRSGAPWPPPAVPPATGEPPASPCSSGNLESSDQPPGGLGALQTDGDCLMAIVDSLLSGTVHSETSRAQGQGLIDSCAKGHTEGAAIHALASTIATEFHLPTCLDTSFGEASFGSYGGSIAPQHASDYELGLAAASTPRKNLVSASKAPDAAGEYILLLARSLLPRLDHSTCSAAQLCRSEAVLGPRRRVARHCMGSLAASIFARLAGQGDCGSAARLCRQVEDSMDRLFCWPDSSSVSACSKNTSFHSRPSSLPKAMTM